MKKCLVSLFISLLSFVLLFTSCAFEPSVTESNGLTETKAETKESTQQENQSTTKEHPPEQEDPASDNVINVLMIGNSFCTYYPDELVGLAEAAGYDMDVYSVYYSGCRLEQHWDWYRIDAARYTFYMRTSATGERTHLGVGASTLRECMQYKNWDYISLQQHYNPTIAHSANDTMKSGKAYAKLLYNMLKSRFPKSDLLWHHTWAFQVGYDRDGHSVPDVAYQTTCYENIRAAAHAIAQENQVPLVPCGDAWQLARANPILGDNLTKDLYHDGETGGGQYLNACVWFEVLTKKSCLDNSFRPSYELSEEKVAALKQAAHEAVAAIYGADWAK